MPRKMTPKRIPQITGSEASHDSGCPYCGIVNIVCFWGPMPEAPWKRPMLLLCATLFLIGIPMLFWTSHRHYGLTAYILAAPLLIVALFSLLVGLRGCDACIARMFGSA